MKLLKAIRYYWVIAAGYRLRPWASPYVRWRLETFFGKQGHVNGMSGFVSLLWNERGRMREFLDWVEERQAAQSNEETAGAESG